AWKRARRSQLEVGVRADRRRQLRSAAEQQRQDDQPELVECAELPERFDGARAADEMDVAAPVRRAQLLQQPRRIALDDDTIRCAGRPRPEDEHVEVLPWP